MSTPPVTESGAIWPSGWCILPNAPALPDGMLEEWRKLPVANVGDCIGRSVGARGLHRYHPEIDAVMCGRAITVRTRPGDNLVIHKAMLMAEPGDVIVIDAGADTSQAIVGGLMRTTAMARRLGGFVIDGAVRDLVEWHEGGMPCFARGHTHRGPGKEGPGAINIPISCGGMVVQPGDLILGDADGILAIPVADLPALLPRVRAHIAHEAAIRAVNAAQGGDRDRIDTLLRSKGVPV